MPRSGSNKNSSSFQSDLVESNVKFRSTPCNTEKVIKIHQTSSCPNWLYFYCRLLRWIFRMFLVSVLLLQTTLFQQMLQNTYLCFFLTTRLRAVKRNISKPHYSFIFKSNFSTDCSISELIYHKALFFSLKFIFSKEYFHSVFAFSRTFWTIFTIVTFKVRNFRACCVVCDREIKPVNKTVYNDYTYIINVL